MTDTSHCVRIKFRPKFPFIRIIYVDLGPFIKNVINQGGGLPKSDFTNKAYLVKVMTKRSRGSKFSKMIKINFGAL